MKILNKLTIKHLTQNKKRTVVTIIGIILSTALMVGIGLLFATVRDNSIKMIEADSGSHHVTLNVDKNKMDIISKNKDIKSYKYKSFVGFSLYEGIENFYKPYIKVLSVDENYLNDLELLEGRLPKNNNEILISNHLIENNNVKIKVGDKIKLNVGKRVDLEDYELINERFTNSMDEDGNVYENEKLVDTKVIEYTVVGICKRDILEKYSDPGYNAFTINNDTTNLSVFITYNKVGKTYDLTEKIATNLGYVKSYGSFKEVTYNSTLLSMYGVSSYDNVTSSFAKIICIILTLVSVACAIVIYNSFAISVMERKKQFGLFSSIGTTRKQLKYTVLFEALIVGLIGIPLGVLSAYIGIGIVLEVVNYLLPNVFGAKLALVTYPLFLIIPIIFIVVTILISAYLPSKRASRISPIMAIRQNDDIKIKSKKVKSPKLITKVFGIEGDIAYKNMKRNKKKYRITIVSLFISIVLFISFSSIVKYGLESAYDFTDFPEYEYVVNVNGDKDNKKYVDDAINDILSFQSIKKANVVEWAYLNIKEADIEYSDKFKKEFKEEITAAYVVRLNEEAYLQYKKEIGLSSNKPIVINQYSYIDYTNSSRKTKTTSIFEKVESVKLAYFDHETGELDDKDYELNDVYLTDKYPMGVDSNKFEMLIVVDDDTFDSIVGMDEYNASYSKQIYLIGSNYDELDKMIEKIDIDYVSIDNFNVKEELKLLSNVILVIKILLYGFISLVTLIGVTSVLNTINTSIALRRTEFAVLRSIGLSPHQFNKILFFESLFFGLKSLLYGLPVALGITLLLHLSFGDIVEFSTVLIPWGSVLTTVIGVFVIIAICMWYSSIKIKHENILDAIRDETI